MNVQFTAKGLELLNNKELALEFLTTELRKGNTDAKQIASKQDYEVNYVSYSYSIPKDVILAVIKEVGTSRVRVYAVLREMGYVINSSTRKK